MLTKLVKRGEKIQVFSQIFVKIYSSNVRKLFTSITLLMLNSIIESEVSLMG